MPNIRCHKPQCEMSARPLKGKPQHDDFRFFFQKAASAFGQDKPYLYAKHIQRKKILLFSNTQVYINFKKVIIITWIWNIQQQVGTLTRSICYTCQYFCCQREAVSAVARGQMIFWINFGFGEGGLLLGGSGVDRHQPWSLPQKGFFCRADHTSRPLPPGE